MRPIHWLHISDFHLRESEVWSQDAVLASMLDDIRRRVAKGTVFDFVLATGDLAFSGQESQYALVEAFTDELADAIDLKRDKIFCVPGNHDVDRARQTTCFAGARSILQSESEIYSFLASKEERKTLLTRLRGFQQFQERYFASQLRNQTDDGLGYVSVVDVDDIKIAIIGLNSAWLAKGGLSDHGRLLLGECQVTNCIEIVRQADPHIVIGMVHHPFELLCEFDRLPVQRRLENACHFIHCGHLHVPDVSSVVTHSGRCLKLAAGASFQSRGAHNAYTVVKLDLLNGQTNVTFVYYDPTKGDFSFHTDESFPHQVDAGPGPRCGVGELANALDVYCPEIASISNYLAALLIEWAAEVPIPMNSGTVFGTVSLLRQQPKSALTTATLEFLTVGNAVKLLYGHTPLADILTTNGQPVSRYGKILQTLLDNDADLRVQLTQRNVSAGMLTGTDAIAPFSHTLALLEELQEAAEWDTLREQAERHIGIEDPIVAADVKRKLALCLSRSTERTDRDRAVALYEELADSLQREATDLASLAMLWCEDGIYERATVTVLQGIEVFPQNRAGFVKIGLEIVEVTGDVGLRDRLLN